MTDSDERLLTAAKLAEQARGELDGPDDLLRHAGLVDDDQDRSTLSFVESAIRNADDFGTSFSETKLGATTYEKATTDAATRAVTEGNGSVMSHIVGVTEQDLDGSALRLPMLLVDELENNDAPAFVLAVGNPNTGKTNTMSLLVELRRYDLDELLVLSNVRKWDGTDEVVTSCHDLFVTLLENRDVPKAVVIDESSTHFDARTYRREVATQWTPLAKRMAKIGVDFVVNIGHSGKDLHPEIKRLSTLSYFKLEKDVVEFYERWPADEDFPTDQLYHGAVENLEPTGIEYDPDDSAPWAWDLRADLFQEDHTWTELLDVLHERGPATD